MKISVIIVCHNSLETLKNCLQSIHEQTYKPYEIIVVDGASTDGTIDYLQQQKNIKLIHQIERGIANARNIGINSAEGEIIAFLDADDAWLSTSIELRVKQLISKPSLLAVGGFLVKSNDLNKPVPAYTPGGFIFKKEFFNTLGEFDEKWKFASDHAWFKKMMQGDYNYELINDIILMKGMHDNNTSILNKTAYREEMLELLRLIKK